MRPNGTNGLALPKTLFPDDERRIRPTATGLQHMHDAADDAAIIHSRFAASVRRQMRREPCELTFVQPEIISIHCRSPLGTLNQKMRCLGIRFMGPNPRTRVFAPARSTSARQFGSPFR